MENSWKAYFIFSKKEQRGIIVVGCMLLASMAVGYLFPAKKSEEKTITAIKGNLFYFDPNTIDSIKALRLGIPLKQVTTLIRYRNKGGRFYQKEDISKLFGLPKELIEKLIPYIVINNEIRNKEKYSNRETKTYNYYSHQGSYSNYLKTNNHKQVGAGRTNQLNEWAIDINTANEKQWVSLLNVSPKLASNIISYRNYLGGFSQINQLKKVYGLTQANFFALKPHLKIGPIKNIQPNANTMSFEQWKLVGLFNEKEIAIILRTRKENGGRIGWKQLVILFDLTENEAEILQKTISISE